MSDKAEILQCCGRLLKNLKGLQERKRWIRGKSETEVRGHSTLLSIFTTLSHRMDMELSWEDLVLEYWAELA